MHYYLIISTASYQRYATFCDYNLLQWRGGSGGTLMGAAFCDVVPLFGALLGLLGVALDLGGGEVVLD